MAGRGAWPASGEGGTLKLDKRTGKVVPGPWYMAAADGQPMIGLAAARALRAGHTPDLSEHAVHLGAKAIQGLLNAATASRLVVDGILGPLTDGAIRRYQWNQGLVVDGQIGPATMGRLLLPLIQTGAADRWRTVYGMLKYEGGFDPGAVGVIDDRDLGLAQINGAAHPEMSVEDRFTPALAIGFNVEYLRRALSDFNGNERDAVLSYNLGAAGVRTWIRAGRPRWWTPPGSTTPRDTTTYVDSILTAWRAL